MAHKLLTPEEIIDEVINYYSENTSRRAVIQHESTTTGCEYYVKVGRKVKMCAVGHCLKRGVAKKLSDSEFGDQDYSGTQLKMSDFQPKYRYNNDKFWLGLQYIHDSDGCWDENGLTNLGKARVATLRNKEWK